MGNYAGRWVRYQDQSGSTSKPVNTVVVTLQNEDCFRVLAGGVARSELLPPQGIVFRNMCQADSGSRGGAGGGGKSARHNGGTPHARGPKRGGNNAEND